MSHQQRSFFGHPNFPKMGFNYPNSLFFAEILTKTIKTLLQSFIYKNLPQQSCSAINYLLNSNNILTGDDPVSIQFGPKGTDPL